MSSETIINSHIKDKKICNVIDFGISYDSDIDLSMKIIQELAIDHPNCIDNRSEEQKKNNDPIVTVKVTGHGESSINLRAYVWSNDSLSGFNMKCDLYKSIKEEFDKNNIEIPFPHRTLVYKRKGEKL
jgi:small-conductance mechanosensitive channel